MILAAILYLLGSIFVLTFLEPEENYEKEIITLAIFWPFFTILAVVTELFNSKKE